MFDLKAEIARKERIYFEKYMEYAKKIKEIAIELLGNADVFLFGSVVEGKATMASDIDVLIVSKNTPKRILDRSKIVAEILKRIDVFAPFEIHLIREEELEWYKRFVKKFLKVE
ncbi:MAG: nucleotidyltransferase domain-containing protein [Archaeoglobaceae archaeon]|nr:nucleotidyltransferase domain-containing protein [Archaeoglobaceae archaeon]MDW8118705.1 nucleotidyltransferase domain-containing protein [Archaeoglobaceae archaeon]